MRCIKDWSITGYNDALEDVPVAYASLDDFLHNFYPLCTFGGLDIMHAFYTWLVAPADRRDQGVHMSGFFESLPEEYLERVVQRALNASVDLGSDASTPLAVKTSHESALRDDVRRAFAAVSTEENKVQRDSDPDWVPEDAYGSLLFTGQGLKPSPGINDRNVKEVLLRTSQCGEVIFPLLWRFSVLSIRVCTPPGLRVYDFVDDLRTLTVSRVPAAQHRVLFLKLVENLTRLGIPLHTKPGKYFEPGTSGDWIGWWLCSVRMLLSVAEARIAKAASKLRVLIDTSLTNGAVYVKDVAMFRGIVISLETLLLDRVFSLSPSRFL